VITPITPEQAREATDELQHHEIRRREKYRKRLLAFIDQSAKRVEELERERKESFLRECVLHEQVRRLEQQNANQSTMIRDLRADEHTLTASLQKAQQQEEQWRNTASATAAELLAARASLQKAREMMRCVTCGACNGALCKRCAPTRTAVKMKPCPCPPCTWWRETGKEGGA
jgi:hypothetical protein